MNTVDLNTNLPLKEMTEKVSESGRFFLCVVRTTNVLSDSCMSIIEIDMS